MNAAVGLTAGLGLDGDRCIRVIPRQKWQKEFSYLLMLTLYHFRTTSPESRKLVKWNAEDALAFLRKSERGNPTFDDYIVSCRTICLLIIKHQQRRQFLTTYGNLSF